MARFTFFLGKGGVGKTTVSSAYALYRAAIEPQRKILLLSTDPAHSLADVFQLKIGDAPKRLRSPGRLWVRQLDGQRQVDQFLKVQRDELLAILSKGSLFTVDEIEPLLDTSLPGMAEVAALLAVHQLLDSSFDEVVVDTAPMGHAIRLFQMVQHFANLLKVLETAASRDQALAQQFGGRIQRAGALDRWSEMVQQIGSALSIGGSKLVLVTTAEPFSLNEAARSAEAFSGGPVANPIAEIVLNRVVDSATNCPRCEKRTKEGRSARKFLRSHFPGAKLLVGEDPGCPIFGVEALRGFGHHIFKARKLPRAARRSPAISPAVNFSKAEWPRLVTPLTLTLGKGGVGKTTISAAIAYQHRKVAESDSVSICSVDPAPSLDDVFGADVGNDLRPVLGDSRFRAAEFDAMTEFQEWAAGLRARVDQAMTAEESGVHLDLSLDRKFLLSLLDVVPPGVDEIFASFRILDLLQEKQRVVIDMAPTGHGLEVLRTPARLLAWTRLVLKTLAAHRTLPFARDAGVEVAIVSQKVRELASILRDPKRCRVVAVTIPEPLPDSESRRLLNDLDDLDATVSCVFVNRVLIDRGGRCRRCRLAAQWQAVSLAGLREQLHGTDVYVVREFETPIAGVAGLRRLTRELWRLV